MGVFRQDPAIQLRRPGVIAPLFVPAAPPLVARPNLQDRREAGSFQVLKRGLVAIQFTPHRPLRPLPRFFAKDERTLQAYEPLVVATSYVERFVPPARVARYPTPREPTTWFRPSQRTTSADSPISALRVLRYSALDSSLRWTRQPCVFGNPVETVSVDWAATAGMGSEFTGRAISRSQIDVAIAAAIAASGRADTQGLVLAEIDAGADIVSRKATTGIVTADVDLNSTISARADAYATVTAGVGAGSGDTGQTGGLGAVTGSVTLSAIAGALSEAAGAITAGLIAGESWAASAATAASLAAQGYFGAQFEAETQGLQIGAVNAETLASATFLAAAETIGTLTGGATLAMVIAAIAQARGAVSANSQFTVVAAALVSALAAINAGVMAGAAWAGHADTAVQLAAAGIFNATFVAETHSSQLGSLTAGGVFAAQFVMAAEALASLTGTANLAAAFTVIADGSASLAAGARFGATFRGVGGDPDILPPATETLEMEPRVRKLHVAPRVRQIDIVPRIRSIRLH